MGLRSLIKGAAALLLFPWAAAPCFASAGYLFPVEDDASGSGDVVLEASFSDVFPEAAIPLRASDWTVIGPDGEPSDFDTVVVLSARTLLAAALESEGTYRFTSGERLGRKGEVARLDGQFVRLGEDGVPRETLPEGAEILTSQTATVSELYLTRGAPSDGTTSTRIGRLAITPLVNPTTLGPGQSLSVQITFDGEPLAHQPITAYAAGTAAEGRPAQTDAEGRFALPLDDARGTMLLVRHIAFSPNGAETDVRSYSTTLSVSAESLSANTAPPGNP